MSHFHRRGYVSSVPPRCSRGLVLPLPSSLSPNQLSVSGVELAQSSDEDRWVEVISARCDRSIQINAVFFDFSEFFVTASKHRVKTTLPLSPSFLHTPLRSRVSLIYEISRDLVRRRSTICADAFRGDTTATHDGIPVVIAVATLCHFG